MPKDFSFTIKNNSIYVRSNDKEAIKKELPAIVDKIDSDEKTELVVIGTLLEIHRA
ncbi:hypothetical protein GCM10011514_41000 [Emticicia aquatilis]|uniref:Uncharacterized protein n=1 Tax=Emticicia aquatilis TaxID=1537369 RepID=A0A917DUW0_9BACT|nr:hypothetical protein GCM10011514_41000 [Emticicia aquatilis]